MKKFFPCLVISFLFFLNVTCGKKGPIYPPLVLKPQKIESFSVIQRGKGIILEWENPTTYTDGAPLDGVAEVEIWLAGEKEESKSKGPPIVEEQISSEEFLKKAELIETITQEKFPEHLKAESDRPQGLQYNFRLRHKDFLSRKYTFGLRIKDRKKRKSDFSGFLSVKPQALPLPPGDVHSDIREDRILILWDAPLENIDGSSPANVKGYNIYRGEGDAYPHRLNQSLIKEEEYHDKDLVFGKTYRYFVRASATESPPYFQSMDSRVIEVEAKDISPPGPPTGLVSIRGKDFISLSWDESQEEDLAGYKVWRREEGQEEYLLLTPEIIRENTFTDTDVKKNKKYIYSVTALDHNGNESKRSKSITEILEDDFS